MGFLKNVFGQGQEHARTEALLVESGLADEIPLDDLYEVEVVGESYRQDVIERIAGGKSEHGKHTRVGLTLRCEPKNPYDSDAVRVECMGQLVGYVARDEAADLSPALLENHGGCIEAHGVIVGGWKDATSEGHFGVRAWIDPVLAQRLGLTHALVADSVLAEVPPPLPGERRLSPDWEHEHISTLTVTCDEHYQDAIAASRPAGWSKDYWATVVTFGFADRNPHAKSPDRCVEVRLSATGMTIGYLTKAMTERHGPAVEAALAANERPTAVANVSPGEKGGQRIWRVKPIMRAI